MISARPQPKSSTLRQFNDTDSTCNDLQLAQKKMQLTNRTPVYEHINNSTIPCKTLETFFTLRFWHMKLDNNYKMAIACIML